jgi:uncharacterized protein YhfF
MWESRCLGSHRVEVELSSKSVSQSRVATAGANTQAFAAAVGRYRAGIAREHRPSVEAFWQSFANATGTDARYEAWAFGEDDTPELATELGLLVRDGPKRATTITLSSFEMDGDPLPEVGGYWVVLDGTGEPLCIVRTTRVEIMPFGEVDEEFAWVEGEGDRSLQYWREAHIRFFESAGAPITDDDLVVLERFDKVWPP